MEPVEIKKNELLRAVNLVRPALAVQNYIPSLTHICFDGNTATAYDDITAISVACNIELECCLPGDLLIKGLNSFSSEDVLIQQDGDAKVVMASGRSKLKMSTLPLDSFPYEPVPSAKEPVTLTSAIISGIEKCLLSVGNDPTHPAQMGVTMEQGENGAVLYSTDNFTISRYTAESKIKLPGKVPVILPTFFCQQLIALSKAFPTETIKLSVNAGAIVATFGEEATLHSKMLVDLNPLDFESIMAKYNVDDELESSASDIPAEFDAAFGRAMLVLGAELDKETAITIEKGRMKMQSRTQASEAHDSIPFKGKAATNTFSVDPYLVNRAAKQCSSMAILNDALVLAGDDYNFVHMIAFLADAK